MVWTSMYNKCQKSNNMSPAKPVSKGTTLLVTYTIRTQAPRAPVHFGLRLIFPRAQQSDFYVRGSLTS